jgi:hypothetical protein
MAALTFVDSFVEDLEDGAHDLNADTIRYTVSNVTPQASWGQLSDITDEAALISNVNTNSSETWPFDSGNTAASASGTTTVSGLDATITATGTINEFRYVWVYNDTATNDELIGWWDNGSGVNLTNTQVFTVDLTAGEILTIAS